MQFYPEHLESVPMPGRITVQKQTLRRAGECTKHRQFELRNNSGKD